MSRLIKKFQQLAVYLLGTSEEDTEKLHRIIGIMDRFVYSDILNNLMLPYAEEEIPIKWRFQQDNDLKNTSL